MEKVKLSLVQPDPLQPRQEFDPADLELLKKSIASQGILTPLVVEELPGGKYLLIDGERRFRASTQLGLKEVPVEVMKPMTELERFIRRFHIQEQHRSWTYFDKARAIKVMVEQGHLSTREVGEVLGIPANRAADLVALLSFSERSQKIITEKRISYSAAVHINRVLKLVEDPKTKTRLEDALVSKVDRGIVTKSQQVDDYGRAIQKGGEKMLNLIISDPDYTPQMALRESKAGFLKTHQTFCVASGWFRNYLDKAIAEKTYGIAKPWEVANLKHIRAQLDVYLKSVGSEE